MSNYHSTRLTLGILLPAVLTAGCGEQDAPEVAEQPPVAVDSAPAPLPAMWGSLVSGSGMSLILSDREGPLLRIACVRDPAIMTVVAERAQPIPSEERLSFGIDGEPFTFVAKLEPGRERGVEGQAPISGDLLQRLVVADSLSTAYGSQTAGPFSPPDSLIVEDFAAACREIGER